MFRVVTIPTNKMTDEQALVSHFVEGLGQMKQDIKEGKADSKTGVANFGERIRQLTAGADINAMSDFQLGEFILSVMTSTGSTVTGLPDIETFGRAMRQAVTIVDPLAPNGD